jgi:DNA-binding MarR family transcriptional regulator
MKDQIAFQIMNEIGIIDQLGTTLFERSMPHGLTMPQFIVLNHFVRLGGDRSPVELANAIQVTKATMTSTLQRLEAKYFISTIPDPKDGRSKRISITNLGRQARQDAIKLALPLLLKLHKFLEQRRN